MSWRRRARLLPLAALLAQLQERLPLLANGPADLPRRQQSLYETMAWSYNLLRPAEQRLFRQLGVFSGGWTLDAAAAVGGGDESAATVYTRSTRNQDRDTSELRDVNLCETFVITITDTEITAS